MRKLRKKYQAALLKKGAMMLQPKAWKKAYVKALSLREAEKAIKKAHKGYTVEYVGKIA